MRLHDALSAHDPSAPAIISRSGRLRFADLLAAPMLPKLAQAARHESVALRFRDPARLVLAIAGLDGRVRRLLLLSPDVAPDVATGLLRAAGASLLLTDCAPLAGSETGGIETSNWSGADDLHSEAPEPAQAGGIETQVLLATSGTTSTPKLVGHTLGSLGRTIRRREGAEPLRWGQMYDIARFAGAQVLMQALVTGAPLVLPDPHAALPDRLVFLAQNGVDAVSATPTLWRKILMSPQSARLSLRQITLGGEIVEDGILAALAQRFPAARIVHIYASTEAGAAFSVADGRAGFPAAYLREPPKGIELKIEGGRLLVKTDRANAAYVGSGGVFADADGFVDTGDAVDVRGDRCIFLGRANGMINVGGNKLFPEEVERVLMAHPSVRMARVSGKKSPMTGQLVMAEVVLADDVRDRSQASALLLSHCRTHLAPWKTPALMRIVADLAPNGAGKLGRGGA